MNILAANLVNIPQPILQGHRLQLRLHAPERRHGAQRYEQQPHEPLAQPGGRHAQYHQWHWECVNNRWIWLRPNFQNLRRSRCIACHVSFDADIKAVERHEASHDHLVHMRQFNVPIDPEFDPHLDRQAFEAEKASIKIILSIWFCDEGVAYKKIDTLLPVIKRISRYPGVLQEVKLSRTTMSKIIKDIIAPLHKQELAGTVSRSKFGTLFDESTGISKDKSGCLSLRIADTIYFKIRTTLWDLIPIYREDDEHNDETAQTLYNLIIESLFGVEKAVQENRVPLRRDNYIASGTDGCNTMVGVHNSVRQRLLENFAGINHITCPCHGSHLCPKHAMEVYFEMIVELLQDCYNWFVSAKRLHRLRHHQIQLNMDIHKILRYVDSRWLTGIPALHRISEQLLAIEATLAEAPGNPQAVLLLQRLRSPSIQCCIAFLKFILEVPEDFNGWMQSEETIFPEVFSRMCNDLKDIALCYMQEDYVENVDLLVIDLEDPDHFLQYDDMRIGDEARQLVGQLPHNDYVNLMERIRGFSIQLATEWLERLVIPWARYQCTECLLMRNAMSWVYRANNPHAIQLLMAQFSRAFAQEDAEIIQMQWENLIYFEQNLPLPANVRTDYFWFYVRQIRNEQGVYLYLELADFALSVLCTPHSNAQPERIWSKEKYIKNKWRNRLSLESVRALLLIKEMLALRDCTKKVHLFEPSPEMIARVRLRIYDILHPVPEFVFNGDEDESESEEEENIEDDEEMDFENEEEEEEEEAGNIDEVEEPNVDEEQVNMDVEGYEE